MNADGTDQRRIFERAGYEISPALSPDGTRLYFAGDRAQGDGNEEIYRVNADGSGLLRLTRNPANDSNPRFSNDGSKIIFSSNRNGQYELFELRL